MREGENRPSIPDPKDPLREAITRILESYNSLCMDDQIDRQRLTDALLEAIWEAEWNLENDDSERIDEWGYEPQDLYGL
jgi:hypothetical protein